MAELNASSWSSGETIQRLSRNSGGVDSSQLPPNERVEVQERELASLKRSLAAALDKIKEREGRIFHLENDNHNLTRRVIGLGGWRAEGARLGGLRSYDIPQESPRQPDRVRIEGEPSVGNLLTVRFPDHLLGDKKVALQWFRVRISSRDERKEEIIADATSRVYRSTADDLGHVLGVRCFVSAPMAPLSSVNATGSAMTRSFGYSPSSSSPHPATSATEGENERIGEDYTNPVVLDSVLSRVVRNSLREQKAEFEVSITKSDYADNQPAVLVVTSLNLTVDIGGEIFESIEYSPFTQVVLDTNDSRSFRLVAEGRGDVHLVASSFQDRDAIAAVIRAFVYFSLVNDIDTYLLGNFGSDHEVAESDSDILGDLEVE